VLAVVPPANTVKVAVWPAPTVELVGWVTKVKNTDGNICSGESSRTLVPSPNWPKVLLPIAQRLLSLLRKRLNAPPAEIAVTPLV